jgi:phosphoserine aminotransferase
MPTQDELQLTPGAAYLHITSNETIGGIRWKEFPKADAPLVADMSSDIMSRAFDISPFGVVYAGAQKNLGPAGVALVIIRKDLAEAAPESVPTLLSYKTHIEKNSLFNTPPCFSIYIVMLVTRWLLKKGGLEAMEKQNEAKAGKIYDVIDGSPFFSGTAAESDRSIMNVTFRLPSEELEAQFIKEGAGIGIKGLKGHRSVGGIRASIYNAFPPEGVDALVSFMKEFEQRNG